MRDRVKEAILKVETLRIMQKRILQKITPDLNETAIERIKSEAETAVGRKLPLAKKELRGVLTEVRVERQMVSNPIFALVKAARVATADAGPGVAVLANAIIRLHDAELEAALPALRGNALLTAAAYAEIRDRPGTGPHGSGENENLGIVREMAAGFIETDRFEDLLAVEEEALKYLAGVADTPAERLDYGHQLADLKMSPRLRYRLMRPWPMIPWPDTRLLAMGRNLILPNGVGSPGQLSPGSAEAIDAVETARAEREARATAELVAKSQAHLGPDWKPWHRPTFEELAREKRPRCPW